MPRFESIVRSRWLIAAAVALTWVSILFGEVLWLSLPLSAGLAWQLISRRHWSRLATMLALSPAGLVPAIATCSFVRGTARLMTVGYPQPELHNVEPSTRLQTISTGCFVSGGEFLWQLPNNVTLQLLARVLGPMPGAYRGPYPSSNDVAMALHAARPAASNDLERDLVPFDNQRITLRKGLGRELVKSLGPDGLDAIRAALWHDTVLILEFTDHSLLDERKDLVHATALIDVTSGKVFAYYDPRGALGRFPRQWT